jgi:hypothetical protein
MRLLYADGIHARFPSGVARRSSGDSLILFLRKRGLDHSFRASVHAGEAEA